MEITTITKIGKTETMTSLEIAELVGREHKSIMRSIREMEEGWVKICGCKFALTSREVQQPNGGTREVPCYELTKRECLYIATKFNDEARAKLIIRWEELETKERTGGFVVPQTFSQALMLAAKQQEQIEEQRGSIGAAGRGNRETVKRGNDDEAKGYILRPYSEQSLDGGDNTDSAGLRNVCQEVQPDT